MSLVEADGGKLQVRGCSFGSDEPCIALRPDLKHAIVSENNGVRGVGIRHGVGDQAVITDNKAAGKGLMAGDAEGDREIGVMGT